MSARVISEGIVVRGERRGQRSSCCMPRIEILPSGRWLVGYRESPRKQDEVHQKTMMSWSDDEGDNWREPVSPVEPPSVEGRPGTFRALAFESLGGDQVLGTWLWQDASNPDQPLFNPATEGVQDMRVFTSVSRDGGARWLAPRRVIERPYERVPVAMTGPTLLLPDGTWMCQFELNKTWDDPEPWRHAAVVSHSRNQGATWERAVPAAHDPTLRRMYWDQRAQLMLDGSLLATFWTFDRAAGEYVNIHAAESGDGGLTWSAPWDTGVPGQPAAPVELEGGRVVMAYVDRQGEPMIKVRISGDRGRSFAPGTEMVVHRRSLGSQTITKSAGSSSDAWAEMDAFSLGLPDAVRLNGHEMLVVYYTGPDKDLTDVRWARIRVDA